MPPWLTLSAIKDGAIVIAIVLLGWWVYRSGENAVHVKDMKALTAQIARLQSKEQEWQNEQARANAHQQADLAQINGGGVIRPLHVELRPSQPDRQGVLSSTTTATAGNSPQARGADVRPQRDIGPALQAFERKYETALAECRYAIASWPTR